MTLQKAWAVDGGGPYPGPQLRMMQRALTGGAEGIVEFGDLRALSLSTPGTSVRITGGQALILGRDGLTAGQSSQQGTYAVWNLGDHEVAVTATGGSPRQDLLVLRVEDPTWPGTEWAHDEATEPLVYPFIIQDVDPGTWRLPADKLWSAIPIARIEMPASTATVQQSYIKDVRQMAAPRRLRELRVQQGVDPVDTAGNIITPDWENWPDPVWEDVFVPAWATQAIILGEWDNATHNQADGNGDATGRQKVKLTSGATSVETAFARYNSNLDTGNPKRVSFAARDAVTLPKAIRGTLATVAMQVSGSGASGRLGADDSFNASVDIEFLEKPIVAVDD